MSTNFLILLAIIAIAGWPLAAADLGGGPIVFVFVIAGWIAAVCLHEFGHAVAAHRGGDSTVRQKGYLTLDPVRYADPLTSLVLPVAVLALGGIGFPGGAVYVRQDLLRGAGWRAAVALAGPAMTAVAMVLLALPFLAGFAPHASPVFRDALALLVFLQATALILNLLPIPGLDGYGAIDAFLPESVRRAVAPIRGYAFMALFAVLLLVPQASAPLFDAALAIMDALGVERGWIRDGLAAFRFWER